MRRQSRIACACVICLLALVLLLAIVFVPTFRGLTLWDWARIRGWGDLRFDPQQWQAANGNDYDCVRGRMIRALFSDYRIEGMTRQQVLQLLGPPDSIQPHGTAMNDAARMATSFSYLLGMYSGFRVDVDYLEIYFDDHGRARSTFLYQG